MAINRLGLSVSEFYDLTPKEFNYALKDNWNRERERVTTEYRYSYEVARYLAVHLMNVQGKVLKRPIRDASKELPFSWEIEQKQKATPKAQTVEEMKEALYSIARIFGTKKKQ